MIRTEFYETRPDGANLYRTYSDAHKRIRKDQTGAVYDEAIDPDFCNRTYTETEELVEAPLKANE
jgi:hypothetical protein